MEFNEIDNILSLLLEKENEYLCEPTNTEWEDLSNKFNYVFPKEFKYFINLMTKWSFPGDIYNVLKNKNNGNDLIKAVYDYELSSGHWVSTMIPFYGIGNGDYFCINSLDSKIYYYYHDNDVSSQVK